MDVISPDYSPKQSSRRQRMVSRSSAAAKGMAVKWRGETLFEGQHQGRGGQFDVSALFDDREDDNIYDSDGNLAGVRSRRSYGSMHSRRASVGVRDIKTEAKQR